MKLIDLLVQELPKNGGWPVIALAATSAINDSHIRFITEAGDIGVMGFPCRDAWGTVTREQYEAALAASQQPVWNGEGMPPIGCICEALAPPSRKGGPWSWQRVKVVEAGIDGAEKECLVYNIETTRPSWVDEFRPIRTEAERKREEAINEIASLIGRGTFCDDAAGIYDAIADGKIPGIKMED